MTDQHRADPELWCAAEKWGTNTMDMVNCLLELRSRVELLEATQHAHVDNSQLSEAKLEQIREELAQRPARLSTLAELLMPRTFTANEVAPIVAPTVKESLTVAPPLSLAAPAANAVLDALYMEELNGPQQLMARAHAAAALRATAPLMELVQDHQRLLTIAAELERNV